MKNSKLIILDCPSAKFRLSLDTMFEKVTQDGATQNGVYINSEKGTGTFRPSCFLVFTYVGEDYTTTKGIYLTVPHMYKLRELFERTHMMLKDPNAFVDVGGNLSVSDQFSEPQVMNGNMKNNDWLALTISTCRSDDNLIASKGVAIQHSKSNGMSSLLTEEEFDALYDIVMHIDFVSIENQAVMTELISRVGSGAPKAAYPKTNNYTAPVRTAGPSYARPQNYQAQGYQSPIPGNVIPTYNNQNVSQPAPKAAVAQKPNVMPPRPATNSPKINMANVESMEVDLDDDAAIDEIFGSDE